MGESRLELAVQFCLDPDRLGAQASAPQPNRLLRRDLVPACPRPRRPPGGRRQPGGRRGRSISRLAALARFRWRRRESANSLRRRFALAADAATTSRPSYSMSGGDVEGASTSISSPTPLTSRTSSQKAPARRDVVTDGGFAFDRAPRRGLMPNGLGAGLGAGPLGYECRSRRAPPGEWSVDIQ